MSISVKHLLAANLCLAAVLGSLILFSKKGALAVNSTSGPSATSSAATQAQSSKPSPSRVEGLTAEELHLASCTVYGRFIQQNHWLPDDSGNWSGTASAISRKGNTLTLITNLHVLGIADLARTTSDVVEVKNYEMAIKTTSGKEIRVDRMGFLNTGLDLSLLEVDGSSLVEGRDYVFTPVGKHPEIHVGDDVVAVGAPLGLSDTQTFGKISAFRKQDAGEKETCSLIQTDAAINHGNSGGPLFLKKSPAASSSVADGRYVWIGVNTSRMDGGANNLGFAIDSNQVPDAVKNCTWVSADPQGAVQVIRACGRKAELAR